MTFEVILHFMKNVPLLNVSIHKNILSKWFINEYARKKKPEIPQFPSFFCEM